MAKNRRQRVQSATQFCFRKSDRLGAPAAEDDDQFLEHCFIDTGELEVLANTQDARSVIVGRTGCGKTALLTHLRNSHTHVASIEPEHLSLQYLSNSEILTYLHSLGVRLDLFYRLLWRHIFTVELIQLRFDISTKDKQRNFLTKIQQLIGVNARQQAAFDYLRDWGESFWCDTEYRIKEVTQKLERDVTAGLGVKANALMGAVSGRSKLTESETAEIVKRAQDVVNSVQIRKLSEVLDILAEHFFDPAHGRYFIIIDRLDEDWVDDQLRYRLIRALIETIRSLRKIESAKVLIALRRDLIDRVFRETRDPGFQEEKYEALVAPIRWTRSELLNLLNVRLNYLVKSRYRKSAISIHDLFPRRIDSETIENFLISRTLYQPRDIILFANQCLSKALDQSTITQAMVKHAEGEYSRKRLRALGDEWRSDFPYLFQLANRLKNRSRSFIPDELGDTDIEDAALSIAEHDPDGKTELGRFALRLYQNEISNHDFRKRLILMYYRVGLVGLKPDATSPIFWSFRGNESITEAQIAKSMSLHITPAFYRVLGISVS